MSRNLFFFTIYIQNIANKLVIFAKDESQLGLENPCIIEENALILKRG